MSHTCSLHFAPPSSGPLRTARRYNSPWLVRSSSVAALDGQLSSLSARSHAGREELRGSSASGELRSSQGFAHTSVMLDEVLELFSDLPDGIVIDATLGGGGHAEALLEARPGFSLIGIDRDPAAIKAATSRLSRFGSRVQIVRAPFSELGVIAARESGDEAHVGVLFDLGVSGAQLDTPERGFSYRFDGPLDMRMDPSTGTTAAELVNTISSRDLEHLLRENGETRFARRIAEVIVAARPFETTEQLAEAVASGIPAAARRRGHPARRVFQALRIATNDELSMLPGAIDDAIDWIGVGGRVVVLAYHSGEDRIVKERFAHAASGGCACPPELPCVCGALTEAKLLTRGARMPSEAEIAENPRAEAARLRALERIVPIPVRRSR